MRSNLPAEGQRPGTAIAAARHRMIVGIVLRSNSLKLGCDIDEALEVLTVTVGPDVTVTVTTPFAFVFSDAVGVARTVAGAVKLQYLL